MFGVLREVWSESTPLLKTFQINAALLIGRILAVVALLPNGMRKIATFEKTAAGMGGVPQLIGGRSFPAQVPLITFPAPELFLGISIVFDLLGAVAIIIGWRTRFVALLLAGYVALAMTIFHADIRGPEDIQHIIRNVAFLGALIMLSAAGGGRWSVDGYLQNRRP